ncbi:hypothetical protein [Nostoc sp.]|uniref:hypothetical protein n=1 Tax=Nostoc sp. TaxID=1180 RepID=UPI002FFC50D2
MLAAGFTPSSGANAVLGTKSQAQDCIGVETAKTILTQRSKNNLGIQLYFWRLRYRRLSSTAGHFITG